MRSCPAALPTFCRDFRGGSWVATATRCWSGSGLLRPGLLRCCLVLLSRLQFQGSEAYCRALLVAFWGHPPRGRPAGGVCEPLRPARLPLAFSAPAACGSRGFQLRFSLLKRVEHPEFTRPSTTRLEIIETFTTAHLEITYALFILMYFLRMNIVLQTEHTEYTIWNPLLPVHHKHFSLLFKVQTVIIVAALNTLSTLYNNLLNYCVVENFYCFRFSQICCD